MKDVIERVAHYTEPESRASAAWIIGEYADKIPDSHQTLKTYFIESFLEEPDNVKL